MKLKLLGCIAAALAFCAPALAQNDPTCVALKRVLDLKGNYDSIRGAQFEPASRDRLDDDVHYRTTLLFPRAASCEVLKGGKLQFYECVYLPKAGLEPAMAKTTSEIFSLCLNHAPVGTDSFIGDGALAIEIDDQIIAIVPGDGQVIVHISPTMGSLLFKN